MGGTYEERSGERGIFNRGALAETFPETPALSTSGRFHWRRWRGAVAYRYKPLCRDYPAIEAVL
jgi:hypothetical protein